MKQEIDRIEKAEFPEILEVWEASVRATHHFLKENDIQYFKPLILNDYLYAVDLRCVRNNEKEIIGFLGVANCNLEMLFIHPDSFGKGVGKTLLNYAIEKLNVTKVDVNEQNHQAIRFYHHYGFKTIKRSELDALGKPYPILHMSLDK